MIAEFLIVLSVHVVVLVQHACPSTSDASDVNEDDAVKYVPGVRS